MASLPFHVRVTIEDKTSSQGKSSTSSQKVGVTTVIPHASVNTGSGTAIPGVISSPQSMVMSSQPVMVGGNLSSTEINPQQDVAQPLSVTETLSVSYALSNPTVALGKGTSLRSVMVTV